MIVELKDTIEKILKKHFSARDDSLLLYEFYLNECGISKETSVGLVFEMVRGDRISSIESVSRCSRWMQEKHPELRGKLYEDRHKKAKKIKQEILNNKT